MCGIYGQYSVDGTDRGLIEKIAKRLAHRGPDGYGIHSEHLLTFGAGRLAIIDLSANAGPIFNEDHSIGVAFNGEIYNYKKLRAELEAQGHDFATQTDTEVIVHGYEAWGVDVLKKLRGMFAIGLWDRPNARLIIARDRLGEKPLYYADTAIGFLFSSEIKGILEYESFPRRVNPDALVQYLTLGYTMPPFTMFEGIHKLSPGEFVTVDRNGHRKARYWQPEMDTTRAADYALTVKQLRDTLINSVEMRLMSDVPVGAFLSGGIDSTAVVGIMSQLMGRPVQTFTVGFDVPRDSTVDKKFNIDVFHAAIVAKQFKSDHHEIFIKQDGSLAELLPYLIYALDEPVSQPSIVQTCFVSALARSQGVPVLLSGDGSDEIFAGYNSYRLDRTLDRYLQIPSLLRESVLSPIIDRLPKGRFESLHTLSRKSNNLDPVSRYIDWMKQVEPANLHHVLTDSTLAANAKNVLSRGIKSIIDAPHTRYFADRLAFTSLNLWLAEDSNMRVDKMSMAMSIETRAPFEDHELVQMALHMPLSYKLRCGDSKAVLKAAVADFVPDDILHRKKWGFFPPVSEWLRTHLRPLVDTYLSPERIAASGVFDPVTVQQAVDGHIIERKYELWTIWPVLVYQIWHALYIDQSLKLDSPLTPSTLVDTLSA